MAVINEVMLKLATLIIRFFQLTLSLVVVGCTAQFISYFSSFDLDLPDAYVAVVVIASITTLWSAAAFLLTCCSGMLLLSIETSLDLMCMGLSIADAVLTRSDALSSMANFANAHRGWQGTVDYSAAQTLPRTAFVISLLLVPLFASTSLTSWSVYWLRRKHNQKHHYHHHEHHVPESPRLER